MTQLQSHTLLPYDLGDRPVPGYTLRRYLGGGAIGHVWLAETDSGFQQAIKVVDLRDAGGRKEFRGLRTVKQRRLLSGNLLTLIDYWLKDAQGNVVPDLDEDADSFFGHAPKQQPKGSPLAATQSQNLDKTEDLPGKSKRSSAERSGPGQAPPRAISKGTLVSSDEDLSCAPTLMAPPILQSAMALASNSKPPVQLIVAMELGHKTLFDRMKECRADGEGVGIPLEELLPYMEHAARGLDYLHREGILHRDVKPHNIMLVGDVAKVCDYGLVVADDYDLSKTSKAYTPYYASPEAVANKALTGRTDQYSLAVAYVEVRAGQLPYSSETAAAVYAAKETGNYELKGIDNPLVRKVLKKALAKEPRERYTTCVEFIKDLARAERTRPKASGGGRLVAAMLAVLLLAGLGGALAYGPSQEYLLGLMGQSRPVDPVPDPEVPDPDQNRREVTPSVNPGGDPATTNPPRPPADPGGIGFDSPPPEREGTNPPRESPSSEQAVARLAERVAKFSAESTPGERAEADVFAFLDAAIRAGAKASDLAAARAIVAEKTFSKYLHDDAPLAEPVLRGEVLRRAALLGGKDQAPRQTLPLVTFVNAEAELENATASGQPSQSLKEQRALVAPAVAILEKAGDSADAALLDYGRFVLARVSAETNPGLNSADLHSAEQILLQWPAPGSVAAGDWRTPRRTRHAAELLARLGDASFTLTDDDILRFQSLPEDAAGKAADFLDRARSLGPTTPQVLGLLSVVRALGPQMTEQRVLARAVADASARALANDDTKVNLAKNKREHLVAYVGALATARLKDADNADANRAALAWFASRLEDPSIYLEAVPVGRRDREVLDNLVLPALEIPVKEPVSGDVAGQLAALWAAKGRLVERNKFVGFGGAEANQARDPDVASLLTAHDAYAHALRLSERESHAAGFGRTLLKLPKDVLEQDGRFALLKRVMPAGETEDSSLLAVASRLLRRQALQAQTRSEKLRLYDEAVRRHGALVQATAISDPYGLASIAQVSASGTHLEAAFYTKVESADESRRPASAGALPSAMTKFDHLQRAVQFANAATLDIARLLPEEAFIAKGNAQEDLAYYYKLTAQYSPAIKAFEDAVQACGVLRSPAYALTCKGRAEFRAANDALEIGGDLEERRALYRRAYISLGEAIQQGVQFEEPRYEAEAHLWMGYLLAKSALQGPGDLAVETFSSLSLRSIEDLKRMLSLDASRPAAEAELRSRLQVWETSLSHFERAATIAKDHWKSDWAVVFRDGMQNRYNLATTLLSLARYAPQLDRGALLAKVAADAQSLLDAARQNRDAIGPVNANTALVLLARSQSALPLDNPAGPRKAREVLRNGESLFHRMEDAWRAQHVNVILEQARLYQNVELETAEKEVRRAEEVAREIQNEHLALEARGNCLWRHADVIYEARVGELAKLTTLKLPPDLYLSFVRAQDLYAQAESALAQADDLRTESSLKLVRAQRFVNLKNNVFKPDFTELERHFAKQFVVRTFDLRTRAVGLITLLIKGELGNRLAEFSKSAQPLAKTYCNLLLPLVYVGVSLEKNDIDVLQVIELKLSLAAGQPARPGANAGQP